MGAACERRRERTVGVVVGVRRGGEEGGGDLGIGGLLVHAEGTLHQGREEDGNDVGDEHRQQQTALQGVEDSIGEEDDRNDQRSRVE